MEQNFPNRSHVFCVFCQMCNFIASNKCETKKRGNTRNTRNTRNTEIGISETKPSPFLVKIEMYDASSHPHHLQSH